MARPRVRLPVVELDTVGMAVAAVTVVFVVAATELPDTENSKTLTEEH